MSNQIPHEFEADTMQVPRGQFSVLWELQNQGLTNAEAIIYLCLNHGSRWNSGETWCMSGPYLSKILGKGMSRSYVLKILSSLTDKGWIETINTNNLSGYRYRIRHHLCDPEDAPVDRDDKPLKFAVPRGPGGPLERCFGGDISWKAALVWIVLKLESNWKAYEDTAGQTQPATLLELSKRCRMKNAGFRKVITELTEAGMLQRLTPERKKSVFQLFPKPFRRPVQSDPPHRREWAGGREIDPDGKYWCSDNRQYRCSRETEEIEKRQKGGTWKRISDCHKNQVMPRAILHYFERAIEAKNLVEAALNS